MKTRVKFYAGFRELFGDKERESELPDGANIQGLLDLLCDSEQRCQKIFDNSGKLRPSTRMLKNGSDIRFLNGIQTKLEEGDVVTIYRPMCGG